MIIFRIEVGVLSKRQVKGLRQTQSPAAIVEAVLSMCADADEGS